MFLNESGLRKEHLNDLKLILGEWLGWVMGGIKGELFLDYIK